MAGLFAAGADNAERLKCVFLRVSLDMDGHDVRASLTEALGIAHGAVDHQMHVERQIRHLADTGQNGQSDRNIGNKQAVHNVNMYILGARLLDRTDLAFQICKICCQN